MTEAIRVVIPGSRCECGLVGHVTNTVTKLRNDVPHPDPYRKFACVCGRKWRAPISSDALLAVAPKPANA